MRAAPPLDEGHVSVDMLDALENRWDSPVARVVEEKRVLRLQAKAADGLLEVSARDTAKRAELDIFRNEI